MIGVFASCTSSGYVQSFDDVKKIIDGNISATLVKFDRKNKAEVVQDEEIFVNNILKIKGIVVKKEEENPKEIVSDASVDINTT